MKALLKLNLRKTVRGKKFYVCLIAAAAILFLAVYVTYQTFDMAKVAAVGSALLNPPDEDVSPSQLLETFDSSRPTAFSSLPSALSNADLVLLAGIFAALFVCEDFEQKTIRTIYGRGYSRRSCYFSSLINVCAASSAMYLASLLLSFIYSAIFFGVGKADAGIIPLLLVQYAAFIALVVLYSSIAFIFRRNGVSIAFAVLLSPVVTLLLSFMEYRFDLKRNALTKFWIGSALDKVSPSLFLTKVPDSDVLLTTLAISVTYIAVFTVVGMLVNDKKDV